MPSGQFSRSHPTTRTLVAGASYFAVVFALGFGLGAFRALVTAPRLGQLPAVVLEVPVILAASWFVSRWLLRVFRVPARIPERLTMGFAAFGLTMLAESTLFVLLFGGSASAYFATFTRPAGLVGLGAQLFFALMPTLQIRRL